MANRTKHVVLELPDNLAVVDWLDHGVSLEAEVVGGKLEIRVKVSHGEHESTFGAHDFTVPLK